MSTQTPEYFPVGSVVASDVKCYLKKSRGTRPYDYEEYWMSAEGSVWPFYEDTYVKELIKTKGFKILRLGKE